MRYKIWALLVILTLGLALQTSASAFSLFDWFGGGATPEPTPEAAVEPTPAAVAAFAPSKGVAAAQVSEKATDESAVIRVYLSSLGKVDALGLTLTGVYSVENDRGFRFSDETDVSIAVDGKSLLLVCGGLSIDMGGSFTLTRHEAGGGVMIHETGRENLYQGNLTLTNDGGAIRAVVALDIEDYLLGVVPYEMSDSFPIEALKAQAVAARTYAMSRKSPSKAYDVVDTTNDQVFRGTDPDTENTFLAVEETRGVVGQYKDGYATCFFTASNGGQTALPEQIWGGSGDYGWLDVRDDPYDVENSSSVVKTLAIDADPAKLDAHLKEVIMSQMTEQMAALGMSDEEADIKLISIDGLEPAKPRFGVGNRMFSALRFTLTVEGKRLYAPDPTPNASTTPLNAVEQVNLSADVDFYGDLKPNYGLKINGSDWEVLSVIKQEDGFTVASRRFGHGVGMSQRGAQQMAGQHAMNWRQILAFYYPGMSLVKMDYAREEIRSLDKLPASVGKARVRPTPKPTPAPLPALTGSEYYAAVELGSKSSTLNVREQPGTDKKLIGTLDQGQKVIVVSETGDGWAKIKTAEIEGYASMDYLAKQ